MGGLRDGEQHERTDDGDTATRILDSAESLVQMRGFNGFSYADVAAELALTKASLHYHFPGKAELGRALIARYAERFNAALAGIDASGGDAPAKLRAYARLYADVLRERRMCLCGMLAAEYQTLPEPMREAVIGFFDENETWLEGVLAPGRDEGTLAFAGVAARGGAADRQRARGRDARGAPLRRRRALRGGGRAAAGRLSGDAVSDEAPGTPATTAPTTATSPPTPTRRSAARSSARTSARTTGRRRPSSSASRRSSSSGRVSAARRRLRRRRTGAAPRARDRLRRHRRRPRGHRPRERRAGSHRRPVSGAGALRRAPTRACRCRSRTAPSTRSSASTRSITCRVATPCSPTGRACSPRAAGCCSPIP